MIQATDNDILRSLGAQLASAQAPVPQPAINTQAGAVSPAATGGESSQVTLSDASKLLNALQSNDPAGHPVANVLSSLIEQLTGKKVADIGIASQSLQASSFSMDTVQESLKVNGGAALDYRYSALHAEAAQISYTAQGSIKLEDGTELAFDFKLEMSSVYVEQTQARAQVDGASLGGADGALHPGTKVRARDNGMEVDMDHRGLRHWMINAHQASQGGGRARGHDHDKGDHGDHRYGHHHGHHRAQGGDVTPGAQDSAAFA